LSRSPEEAPGELKYDQVPLSREEPLLRAMMSYNLPLLAIWRETTLLVNSVPEFPRNV